MNRNRILVAAALLPLCVLAPACRNNVGDEGWTMNAGVVPSTVDAAMTNACAAGTTVKGIDVSYYQGTINWTRVKNDGVKYAFIRVSDGTGFHDSQFARNWREAKAAGVMRGAYQFFRSDEDPIAQADLLIAAVGGALKPGDLPPVIDVESTDGRSAAVIAQKARQWSNRIEDKLKVKPIVYTGPYFWRDSVNGADLNDHKLWVAHYGTSCPLVPPTWTRWTFHQHTSSGRVDGIAGNVDMNRYNGDLDALKGLTFKDDRPRACVSGTFDGAFCDDDTNGSETNHDRLKDELGVDFHCSAIAGEPAFCPNKKATRAQAMFVLGDAFGMPLSGHDNAFSDDGGHAYERYLNAAQDFGVLLGTHGKAQPNGRLTRSALAVFLKRMFLLPPADRDYFDDDDDSANEDAHNRVAAAGLIVGYADANGGRRDFRPTVKATRSSLATVAVRAFDRGLVPTWKIPQACKDGGYEGLFCDDDASGGVSADLLNTTLGVDFTCGELAGEPAFCPSRDTTRAEALYVLTAAAHIPTNPAQDFFSDDDDSPYEDWIDAAKGFAIITGYDGGTQARPALQTTRDMLAIVLARMYALPDPGVDYFVDDEGTSMEIWHNKVAAAGLFTGYNTDGGRAFRGDKSVTRGTLALLAARAFHASLVPLWGP